MAQLTQIDHHLAAAVERMPRVFGINQSQQRQFFVVRFRHPAGRVGRGSGNPRQLALTGQRQRPVRVDPALAVA